jgi:hypothetical protein
MRIVCTFTPEEERFFMVSETWFNVWRKETSSLLVTLSLYELPQERLLRDVLIHQDRLRPGVFG